jgi:hypothetical protein
MRTKNILLVAVATIVIVALVLWRHGHPVGGQPPIQATDQAGSTNQSFPPKAPLPKRTVEVAPGLSPEGNFTAWEGQRTQQMANALENARDQWRTPIAFYGKVVDENGTPVAEANINFTWTDLSADGSSGSRTSSDEYGLFALQGVTGKNLHVEVSKAGYYSFNPSGLYYNYAGGEVQIFVPDMANPVVFRLKKRGIAEHLIHVHAGAGGLEGIRTPKDGSPVGVSLTTGNEVNGQGDLIVQCWTDDQGKSSGEDYNWKCQITAPGGGILQRTDDLEFQAPTNGYQVSDVIDMPTSLGNQWARDVKRNYFVRLANGNYARINFEMIAGGTHFFQLESFLNPNGSPNLEFDPNQVSNP